MLRDGEEKFEDTVISVCAGVCNVPTGRFLCCISACNIPASDRRPTLGYGENDLRMSLSFK